MENINAGADRKAAPGCALDDFGCSLYAEVSEAACLDSNNNEAFIDENTLHFRNWPA